MKIFYHCFGGAHTSITCASIHMKYLPNNRIPNYSEFKTVPFYDKMSSERLGTPLYFGRDEYDCDVYAMGMTAGSSVVIPAIFSYLNTNYINGHDVCFVNALVKLHPITSIGGVASRRFGLVLFGRPMTVLGIRKSYPILVDLVSSVKDNIRNKV